MTWQSHYRRGDVLRHVAEAADRRRDGFLPMDVPGVRETFGDELTLLAALQLRWHTRLAGHLERVQATQPMDLPASVVAAWHAAVDDLPGTRMILERYAAEPTDAAMGSAMATAVAKERTLLAVMAGQCAYGDREAPALGAALEESARATYHPADCACHERRPASLLHRLRAAFAA